MTPRRVAWLAVGAALAVGLACVWVLPATLDEAFVIGVAGRGVGAAWAMWFRDPQGLLPHLVAVVPAGMDSLIAVRAVSLVATVAAVGVTMWAFARLVGPRGAALAGLTMAVSAHVAVTAANARWPALCLLTAAVAWGALARMIAPRESGERWSVWAAAYAVATSAAVYCNVFALLLIPGHVVLAALLGGRRIVRRLLWLQIAVSVMTIPLIVRVVAVDGPNPLVRLPEPSPTKIVGLLASLVADGPAPIVRLVGLLGVAGGVAWALWGSGGAGTAVGRAIAAAAAAPVVLGLAISLVGPNLVEARYYVGVLPALFGAVGATLASTRRQGPTVVVCVALLIGMVALIVRPAYEPTATWVARLTELRGSSPTPVVFYEAEGVQVAGVYARAFRSADGGIAIPGWGRAPAPDGVVLRDRADFHRLPPGPPSADEVREWMRRTGAVVLVLRPPGPSTPAEAWAREHCRLTAFDYVDARVVRIDRCAVTATLSAGVAAAR